VPSGGLCQGRAVTDYQINRAGWNERVPAHAASPEYGLDRYATDPSYLSHVVRFDRPRLGDIAGLRGVHLQCHLGTDTISLHRLGARMTGLDFSEDAVERARILATDAGADVDFVLADVYDAAQVLPAGAYDLVYTGIGALCWLPDVQRWARVVSALLKPGGRLFIREGHPMLWALDDTRDDGALVVDHPYFEREEPLVWTEGGTYVTTDVEFTHNTSHQWNHGLGEIVTAVQAAGLDLTMLEEHDSAPWNALPGSTVMDEHEEWRLRDRPWRLPQTYTMQARKRRLD
jgi:SAM-dependent methyltransferase